MLIAALLFFVFTSSATTIEKVVHEFHALSTKNDEQLFISKYKNSRDQSVLFYVIATRMKQAEYTYNPVKKLQIFNGNRNILDRLIKEHADNIHGRYVRLVIQERMPRIVGYYQHIEQDKHALKTLLGKEKGLHYLEKYIKLNTSL